MADLFALASAAAGHDPPFAADLFAEKLDFSGHPAGMASLVFVARAGGQRVGFLQRVLRPAERKAWIGMFAVRPDWRRRGVGSALFAAARAGVTGHTWEALAVPGNYFAPGLDPRYTEALCLLESLGFARFKDCANLTVDLAAGFGGAAEEAALARQDVELRRAVPGDGPLLDAFFAAQFGADWRYEAGCGLRCDPPALHLALREQRVIAFSAHSTQNRAWGFFGPMGTAEAARGLGLGRLLLWRCLNDLRAAGHRTAIIPWVGPIRFYQQWAGARVARVFWRYRLDAAGG